MTSKDHKKHTSLTRPVGGNINANELGFIGAPCGIIQSLCNSIASELSSFRFGFVDADHSEGESKPVFNTKYTDKISYHDLSFSADDIQYDFRQLMKNETMVLVNGNHFEADKQVVFIHEKKKDSLKRKLDRLTDVKFFILADDQTDLYDFLLDHNPSFNNLPKYKLDNLESIIKAVQSIINDTLPKVNGLVLAGGKSVRMGHDKGQIAYHGKPQRTYVADLLKSICDSSFISTQEEDKDDHYPIIEDTFKGLGPFGGILSAFRENPNTAWLTVATDIPFVSKDILMQLIEKRDPNKVATCFHNPETGFPEPLITLWEPKAYQRLLYFLSLGYSCPRKVLINSDINEIHLKDANFLYNANTPEEMRAAMEKING